jgi:nucleotide-binding universal stress UspA family protein
VEVALVEQRPTEALVKLADELDARAIVVGTFGEHPIKGALLGSVPHKLLHLSERPVLVVPVPE